MLLALKNWLKPDEQRRRAQAYYAELVEEARDPYLYEHCGVPDTVKGRSESIMLLLFLHQRHLRRIQTPARFIRFLCEAFVTDMDRSLREMGVGDTGVGKRVKRMAGRLILRMRAYEQAFADTKALAGELSRHFTDETVIPESKFIQLAEYAQKKDAQLASHVTPQPAALRA